MKKRWMAAVAVMAAWAVMAGCGGSKEEPAKAGTEETSSEADGRETAESDAGGDSSGEEESWDAQETDNETAGDYIFPESGIRLLTAEELKSVTAEELRLARNEIYARHGRLFTSAELQDYFEAKEWYEGSVNPEDFSDSMLSQVERDNINLIKAREELGDILDTAAAYKKIMEENQLFGWNGLLDYGHIGVSMSSNYRDWYPALEDRGSYYEAEDQILCVPVYYDWDYIKNIKAGDKLTLSFGMSNESQVYTVIDILQEHGQEARVLSVFASGQYGETPVVFTDAFHNGKYVLAIADEVWDDGYYIWNSDDISCACETLYTGSFYLSKDCVIDVAGEMRSVEDQWEVDWETNPFGGAIFGDIEEVDENGLITRIRQQVAG